LRNLATQLLNEPGNWVGQGEANSGKRFVEWLYPVPLFVPLWRSLRKDRMETQKAIFNQ
jgi:hypothetical protein